MAMPVRARFSHIAPGIRGTNREIDATIRKLIGVILCGLHATLDQNTIHAQKILEMEMPRRG